MIPLSSRYRRAALSALVLAVSAVFSRAEVDIQKLIDEAIKQKAAEVVIPPGTYRVQPAAGSKVHLQVKGAKNLAIKADGVTLLCGKRTTAVEFASCKNVSLRGLTIDYDPLCFTQGKVIGVAEDNKWVDVQLDEGYPREAFSRIDVVDPVTRFRKRGMPFLWDTKAEMAGDATVRVFRENIGKAVKVGDLASLSTGPDSGGQPHGMTITSCADMVFERVIVHSAPGFGIFESDGQGGSTYRQCAVEPGPKPAGATESRLLSSSWDAMMAAAVRKGPVVEECRLEKAGDDSWSVQSTDYLVLSVDGSTAVIAARHSYDVYPKVGERFTTGLNAPEAVITSLRPVNLDSLSLDEGIRTKMKEAKTWEVWGASNKAFEVTVNGDFPFPVGQNLYNPDRQCNGFVFRNNRLHNSGRILIKASDGLIEGNEVKDGHAGVTLAPEYPGSIGGLRNIVIRNNRFVGTGYFCAAPWSGQAGCISMSGKGVGGSPVFKDIVIEKNYFEDFNGPGILVVSADGVRITDNLFQNVMAEEPNPTGRDLGIDGEALIWVARSSNLTVTGNRVVQPGAYLKKKVVIQGEGNGIVEAIESGIAIE